MKVITLIIVLVFGSVSFAGSGHGHSHGHAHGKAAVTKNKAKTLSQSHVGRLIKLSKIDASWSKATFDKIEKKEFGKKKEWVATFNNKKGIKGKKLYIFLSTKGEFVAANFTGK